MNIFMDLIYYLQSTNWILFSIAMFGVLMIGAFIISAGMNMKEGTFHRELTVVAGIFIACASVIMYIDRYRESFKIILKWIGIGLLIIFAMACIAFIVLSICERDVNSKRKSRCNADIVFILTLRDEYYSKMLKVGNKLTHEGKIVIYEGKYGENYQTDPTLEDKIRLCDYVVVVSENGNIDDSRFEYRIHIAEKYNKKIKYEIGDIIKYDDNDIRNALHTDPKTFERNLAKRGFTNETIYNLSNLVDSIRKVASIDDMNKFVDRQITFDDLNNKYHITED